MTDDTTESPQPGETRLEFANRLYREYHVRCFWHCRPDLVITEDRIPMLVKGLREHGGRRGMFTAARLLELPESPA
jgi:hypothetical protein